MIVTSARKQYSKQMVKFAEYGLPFLDMLRATHIEYKMKMINSELTSDRCPSYDHGKFEVGHGTRGNT